MFKLRKSLEILLLVLMATFSNEILAQDQEYEYAVVYAEERDFANGYRVTVDLGETPEQIKLGEEYSEILDKKKSLAAVINFMAHHRFDFVQAVTTSSSYQGTGSTDGPVFFFRRKL
ncbi:hypothetical protein [Robiginitalea aurantiaca]|uniref:Uncharacterized protein n=1 Tax=Robiginitalea aurantiaca TaxID=3056915 RepID=A0ABT7WBH0_9FLAO|nr:hypothetical protein [Robiginitalea aurantiaca]MDM9630260.1 hypothetical protein [Robiginitalea aurantiaca]